MPLPEEVESSYYAAQGFEPTHAREVRSFFVPFVAGRDLLVELGAGRGEFLEVVRDHVGRVVAVDVDPVMCDQVRSLGIDAVQAEVGEFLADTDLRPDAVFAAHLIEHLPVDAAFDMLCGVARIVPEGGRVVVVTPNPACLAVLTNDFWSDPTHVRIYTIDLLSFLVSQAGFEVVESGGNPVGSPGAPPEMHPPAPLGPWERQGVEVAPRATIEIDDGYRVDTLLDEVARLRRATEALAGAMDVLGDQVIELRAHAEETSRKLGSGFGALYGPNEIYVVGERRG